MIPQKENRNAGHKQHYQDYVKSVVCRAAYVFHVSLTMEIANPYRYRGSHAVIHHKAYL